MKATTALRDRAQLVRRHAEERDVVRQELAPEREEERETAREEQRKGRELEQRPAVGHDGFEEALALRRHGGGLAR